MNNIKIIISGNETHGFLLRVELPAEFVARFREEHNIVVLDEPLHADWGHRVNDTTRARTMWCYSAAEVNTAVASAMACWIASTTSK